MPITASIRAAIDASKTAIASTHNNVTVRVTVKQRLIVVKYIGAFPFAHLAYYGQFTRSLTGMALGKAGLDIAKPAFILGKYVLANGLITALSPLYAPGAIRKRSKARICFDIG
jgi:hypothetical protein